MPRYRDLYNVGRGDYKRSKWIRKGRKRWADEQSVLFYRMAFIVFHTIYRFWVRCYRSFGEENVPKSGSIFVLANHTTGMDPFLLGYGALDRMLCGPGKIELFVSPFWGWAMRKIGMFPLRQKVADAASVRTMIELYRSGRAVVIFPEGGRSRTGELQPFVPDVTRLMIRMKARAVPCAVAGGTQLLPMGARFIRRRTPVVVGFGPEIDLSEFYSRQLTPELVAEATELLHDRVAALLTEAERRRAQMAQDC